MRDFETDVPAIGPPTAVDTSGTRDAGRPESPLQFRLEVMSREFSDGSGARGGKSCARPALTKPPMSVAKRRRGRTRTFDLSRFGSARFAPARYGPRATGQTECCQALDPDGKPSQLQLKDHTARWAAEVT